MPPPRGGQENTLLMGYPLLGGGSFILYLFTPMMGFTPLRGKYMTLPLLGYAPTGRIMSVHSLMGCAPLESVNADMHMGLSW